MPQKNDVVEGPPGYHAVERVSADDFVLTRYRAPRPLAPMIHIGPSVGVYRQDDVK